MLKKYKTLPWPLNLWSTVFRKEIRQCDLPPNWGVTLNHVLATFNNEKRAKLLLMYFRDGMCEQEISEILCESKKTIINKLVYGVEKLQYPSLRYRLMYGALQDNMRGIKKSSKENSIDALGLSTRPYNCLQAAGVTTIDQLCSYSERDLLALPSMGALSVENIKSELDTHGFSLKGIDENTHVDALGLNARYCKCFQEAGVATVGQLCSYSEQELLNLQSMSVLSVERVKDALAAYGFSLSEFSQKNLDENDHIEALGLSTRPYNCLQAAGVTTISQLCSYSEQELLNLQSMSVLSVEKVKGALAAYGFSLKGIDENAHIDALGLNARYCKRLQEAGVATIGQLCSYNEQELLNLQSMSVLSVERVKDALAAYGFSLSEFSQKSLDENDHIEALGLSTRPYNCLRRGGVTTIGQLCSHSEQELLNLRSMGVLSVEKIKDALAAYGFSLSEFSQGSTNNEKEGEEELQ